MYASAQLSDLPVTLSSLETTVQDVKTWTLVNKLQLNEDKTEALLIDPKKGSDLPTSISVCGTEISFSDTARNLGVMFD